MPRNREDRHELLHVALYLSKQQDRDDRAEHHSGPIYIDANSAHGGTGTVDIQGKFSCSGCTIVMTNSNPTSNARRDLVSKCAGAN